MASALINFLFLVGPRERVDVVREVLEMLLLLCNLLFQGAEAETRLSVMQCLACGTGFRLLLLLPLLDILVLGGGLTLGESVTESC